MPERLLEIGVLLGTLVEVVRVAPLGDPVALRVKNGQLAIRRADVARICVSTV